MISLNFNFKSMRSEAPLLSSTRSIAMASLPILALFAALAWAAASPPAWASLARVDYDAPPVPNASSLVGLTVCGYQQWFRAPNATATNEGWTHWGNGVGALHNGTGIEEDYWPDLSEFGDDEKFAAPGYAFADGSQAYLFSSINARTIVDINMSAS